jgi:hypothetical protein
MTRVRYTKDNGVLTSKALPGTDGNLFVMITQTGAFVITFKDGRIVYQSDKQTPLHNAKKLVKTALKALGVVFTDEVRPKLVTTAADEAEMDYQQEHQS